MVAALEFSRQLHTGIVLTATGVSRCVEVEGYAVLTPLPSISQVGIGIAFEVPVVAEACGLGGPGLDEEVEVKVYGRGLAFSTPSLPRLLEEAVMKAYVENGELKLSELINLSEPLARAETIIASLEGSTIVINGLPIPLYDAVGAWGVIVRLDKPLNRAKIVENILSNIGIYEDIILEGLSDIMEALYTFTSQLYESAHIDVIRGAIRQADRFNALSVFVDVSGKYIAFILKDYDDAIDAASSLSLRGSVLEAPLTALGT